MKWKELLAALTCIIAPIVTMDLAAQASCSADVSVESFGTEDDERWEISFRVSVDDCRYSSGSFEFDFVVVNADGSERVTTKREIWRSIDSDETEVKHVVILHRSQIIDEVSEPSKIRCLCNE